MRKTLLKILAAAMLAGAMFVAAPAVAQDVVDDDEGVVVSVVKKAQNKEKLKFPWKGYALGGTFCSAITEIGDAVITGATEQRQLTTKKAIANAIGCFTVGIGRYVYLALDPETPEDIRAAGVAWRFDKLAWRQQQTLLALGAKEPILYPSLSEMQQALGEGPKIKKRLKKRRWRR